VFRTKGQLAIDLVGEVLADGIGLDFACGDEVYGSCTQLREYLEARGLAYVLRVPSNFYLTVTRGVRLTCKQAAATLAGTRRGREIRSAGPGAKGQRWYAWAWPGTAPARHYLLIRRHLATGELAFHYCFVPEGQPVSLSRLIRAAGLRWPAEGGHRWHWSRPVLFSWLCSLLLIGLVFLRCPAGAGVVARRTCPALA
jgi:DDE superfamily endonuclease